LLLPELGEEAGGSPGEVGSALGGEEFAVDLKIFLKHLEAISQFIAGDFAVLYVNFFEE
jgi:hypothetical protein